MSHNTAKLTLQTVVVKVFFAIFCKIVYSVGFDDSENYFALCTAQNKTSREAALKSIKLSLHVRVMQSHNSHLKANLGQCQTSVHALFTRTYYLLFA